MVREDRYDEQHRYFLRFDIQSRWDVPDFKVSNDRITVGAEDNSEVRFSYDGEEVIGILGGNLATNAEENLLKVDHPVLMPDEFVEDLLNEAYDPLGDDCVFMAEDGWLTVYSEDGSEQLMEIGTDEQGMVAYFTEEEIEGEPCVVAVPGRDLADYDIVEEPRAAEVPAEE